MTPGHDTARGWWFEVGGGRWVCFFQKTGLAGSRSGVFGVVEGDLGSFGGFDWLCFVEEGGGKKKKMFRGAGGTGFLHDSSGTRVMEW
jgi:hypothetical protein